MAAPLRSDGTRDAPDGAFKERNLLNLDFSPEQEMLRTTVRGLLASVCPISAVRELEDDPIGYQPVLWKQLAELDLIGLLLPEAYGGSEMTALEGIVLYEELGRSLAPVPHFVSAVLCGGVLASSWQRGAEIRVASSDRHGRRRAHGRMARAGIGFRSDGRAVARRAGRQTASG